jgi:hypothetical protein
MKGSRKTGRKKEEGKIERGHLNHIRIPENNK